MAHRLSDTITLLERTPAALDALLRDLPEFWTNRNEGEGTFSIPYVIGHLIYADKENWLPRARHILEHGESSPFEKFDRWGHVEECRGKSLPQLLGEFSRTRAVCLDGLLSLNLQPTQLEQRGSHPALGTVTLSELLATWAAHDLTHLHQISRILAGSYRNEVGPFATFLGVLKCNGHGG
ncbi:MAG TPA: DinB family protein [Terracidiphilus sp.]|jgi:hypothetical protein|nr:DinB family protein [Terracidiphilus sp.]